MPPFLLFVSVGEIRPIRGDLLLAGVTIPETLNKQTYVDFVFCCIATHLFRHLLNYAFDA